MGVWGRLRYALGGTVALAAVAYIYLATVATRLTDTAANHPGPFSFVIEWINNIVPVAILMLLLALWAWVIAAAVQQEKSVRRVPRR